MHGEKLLLLLPSFSSRAVVDIVSTPKLDFAETGFCYNLSSFVFILKGSCIFAQPKFQQTLSGEQILASVHNIAQLIFFFPTKTKLGKDSVGKKVAFCYDISSFVFFLETLVYICSAQIPAKT